MGIPAVVVMNISDEGHCANIKLAQWFAGRFFRAVGYVKEEKHMKTILVPVDGSEHSVRALKTALSMFGEEVRLRLHVITVQMPIASGNVTRFFSAENIKAFYDEEGRKALEPVKHLIELAGDTCTEKVLVGSIAETITEYAKEYGCDHIIMGTRGLGRVSGLVLGSITSKVISLSTVPITLVK